MTVVKKLMSMCLAVLVATGLFYVFPSAVSAEEGAEVNVQIVFDAEGIVKNHGSGGSIASPKYVSDYNKYIFMCTENSYDSSYNCYADLNINACENEDINFFWTTLSNGSPDNVVVNEMSYSYHPSDVIKYGYLTQSGWEVNYANVGDGVSRIDVPESQLKATQDIPSFVWRSENYGSYGQAFNPIFTLYSSGKRIGSYYWDPYVSVNSNC